MAYTSIPESELAPLVGKLIGKIQGEVETRILSEVDSLLNEFSNNDLCSNINRVSAISKKKENISKILTSYSKRVDKIRKITTPLLLASNSFKVVINILKVLPIPNTVLNAGAVVTFSDKLQKAKEFVSQIEKDVEAINKIIVGAGGVIISINSILNSLNILDKEIQKCSSDTQDLFIINENTIPDPKFNPDLEYTNSNGVSYKFEIVVVSEELAPLRYVQAREVKTNRVKYKSETSYSSSITVLIEELKFKIESDLT